MRALTLSTIALTSGTSGMTLLLALPAHRSHPRRQAPTKPTLTKPTGRAGSRADRELFDRAFDDDAGLEGDHAASSVATGWRTRRSASRRPVSGSCATR